MSTATKIGSSVDGVPNGDGHKPMQVSKRSIRCERPARATRNQRLKRVTSKLNLQKSVHPAFSGLRTRCPRDGASCLPPLPILPFPHSPRDPKAPWQNNVTHRAYTRYGRGSRRIVAPRCTFCSKAGILTTFPARSVQAIFKCSGNTLSLP